MPTTLQRRIAALDAERQELEAMLADPNIDTATVDMLRHRLDTLPTRMARASLKSLPQPDNVEVVDWRGALDGDPGQWPATPNNLAIALEQAPQWAGVIRWDEFNFRATLAKPVALSLRRRAPVLLEAGDLPEHVSHHIQSWLDSVGIKRAGKDAVWDTISAVSRRESYHPVRKYLLRVWKENPMTVDDARELLRWLWPKYYNVEVPTCLTGDDGCRCANCTRSAAVQLAGLCWPISAVARMLPGKIDGLYERPDANRPDRQFGPGCLVKYVPILIGDQDYSKSSAISALVHDQSWCLDSRINLADAKSVGEAFRGKWIAEIAEIDGTIRSHDGATLKAIISTRVETFRDAYARFPSDHPRQCVLIGTSNASHFLRDPDNTVRYWLLHVAGPIDTLPIARDRDLIWSAAVTLFTAGEPWWPARGAEAAALRSVAEEALDLPDFADRLTGWLSDPITPDSHRYATESGNWHRRDAFPLADILALNDLREVKLYDVKRVLHHARWRPDRIAVPESIHPRRIRVWTR